MSTGELIEALKGEYVITEGSSLETKLTEDVIDGDVLAGIRSEGRKGLLDDGVRGGDAFWLDRLYRWLLEDKERQKRPKICKSQSDMNSGNLKNLI